MSNSNYTNALIHSSSPYLLQHAHNPVNWYPWGKEALEKALAEDKPLLISIGYSACHWCHVMEHECFEDEATAQLMNDYFVCIKVDREERPDIDQLYMSAVQLMSNKGGWPLNCFALPDGRPIYGGTYFPKAAWQNALRQIHQLYTEEHTEVLNYASKLTEGLKQTELIKSKPGAESVSKEDLAASVSNWLNGVDHIEGGPNRAPKFPLPDNYLFLLRYGHITNNKEVLNHVHLTLTKMAFGGIYDQVGGGFSRYSTDGLWKIPHFEKMLYDNGQLLSLYAEAYHQSPDAEYLRLCFQTINFVKSELTAQEGYFYSALDADSEGKEGFFYTWSKAELEDALTPAEYNLAKVWFNVNEAGLWEHDRYILIRKESTLEVSTDLGIPVEELLIQVEHIKNKLLQIREKRVKPGLDDKLITGWNCMMIRGLADCSRIFENNDFLKLAVDAANFLLANLQDDSGTVFRTWKNGKASIPGFLEDYAFMIDAFIGLYQVTFDEHWLVKANALTESVFKLFPQTPSGLFYYTSTLQQEWVTRQLETSDNVIPASNSVMACNLFYLGNYFEKTEWIDHSSKMIRTVRNELIGYGPGYSHWAMLASFRAFPFGELVITGKDAEFELRAVRKAYNPCLLDGIGSASSLIPLLKKGSTHETGYFLCHDMRCEAPVYQRSDLEKMLDSLQQN
jgi:uncharacterized protein YyaL (SSP411 family)